MAMGYGLGVPPSPAPVQKPTVLRTLLLTDTHRDFGTNIHVSH